MIEILNPDLTPFDNLIPDFQAGEDTLDPLRDPEYRTGPARPETYELKRNLRSI